MFRLIILVLYSALAALGDGLPVPVVRGEVQSDGVPGLAGGRAQLKGVLGSLLAYEGDVHADGTFVFRMIPAGSYTLLVSTGSGDVVVQEMVEVTPGSTLRVRARSTISQEQKQARPGTVAPSELRNPPSRQTLDILAKAHRFSESGDHAKALRELTRAADKNPSDGYLRTNLGVEYIRVNDLTSAIAVLEEAVRLIPDSATTHGNLAYALYLKGDWDRAQTEARASLAANHSNVKMRYILGAAQLAKGEIEDGVANLRAARATIPQARLLLAQHYLRSGKRDSAKAELQAFAESGSAEERAQAEKWLAQIDTKD